MDGPIHPGREEPDDNIRQGKDDTRGQCSSAISTPRDRMGIEIAEGWRSLVSAAAEMGIALRHDRKSG